MADQQEIIVVSGLPRSGTSMLMGMLAAGGVPVLVDQDRPADEHNPRGYFEYTPVKRLRVEHTWVPQARGRAVKVISFLLPSLPPGEQYRVLYVERDLEEVLASQAAMLGEAWGPGRSADALRMAWRSAEGQVASWLEQRPEIALLRLAHREIVSFPREAATKMAGFLGRELEIAPMVASVDRGLHRQRRSSAG